MVRIYEYVLKRCLTNNHYAYMVYVFEHNLSICIHVRYVYMCLPLSQLYTSAGSNTERVLLGGFLPFSIHTVLLVEYRRNFRSQTSGQIEKQRWEELDKSQRREEKTRDETRRDERRGEERRREEKRREEEEEEEKRRRKKKKEERRSEKRKRQKKQDQGVGKGRKVAKNSVFPMFWGSGRSKSRLAKAAGAEPTGQMRDEKLHAVVARSRFRSQNSKSTSCREHFWDVEMFQK